MSNKKGGEKKGSKNKEKEREKEKLLQEERKKEQEKLEAQQRIGVLEQSGILDAYEYFLTAICKNGLPEANIFEFAAQQILKYQKKVKQRQGKRQGLEKSLEKVRSGSIETKERPGSIEKKEAPKGKGEKPQVMPFKGEAKEEALKALKK